MINKKYLHGWISTNPSIVKFNKYILLALCLTISLIGWTQPTITSFVPANGSVGTSVTITGTGFDATAASNIVFFGATQATVSAATTTVLTVTVPIGATYIPITVLVNGLLAYSSAPFVVTHSGGGLIDANTFAGIVEYPTGKKPISASIGDLNGDGKVDLVVSHINTSTSYTVSTFKNESSGIGNINYPTKINLTSGDFPISIGDLDGDGKADLAVVNQFSDTVSIFRNTSQGAGNITYATKVDYIVGFHNSLFFSVSIGDLDGDGKADLAITNLNGLHVLRNTSTAVGMINYESLNRNHSYSLGQNFLTSSASIGDLDGDGKVDLVLTNSNGTSVSVLRNMSTEAAGIDRNSFRNKMDFATGDSPSSVSIGDLDGDGKADLVVANKGSNTVSVLRNTSSGIGNINYADKMDYSTGNGPTSVSIGDLDGDGKVDLAVVNNLAISPTNNNHTVSVFKNNSTIGTIEYADKVDYETGVNSFPRTVSIGDLDGDGEADLVITNFNTNKIAVLRNVRNSSLLGIKEMANLRIYPNPVTDYLNITGINTPYSVQLLNIPGQIVYNGTNDRSLNLLNFDKGIYYLKITVENGDYQTWKIIKD